MIPKIIWQTHEWEYEDLPIHFKQCVKTWKNLNPNWEYIYHSGIDRANIVKNFDKELYSYYMFADKVTQSDIWRYVVTYQYGGFYTDMDSVCTMPLDYFIKLNSFNGKELFCTEIKKQSAEKYNKTFEVVNNSCFGVIKNSFITKKILDNILFNYKKIGTVLDIYNDIERQSGTSTRVVPKCLWLGPQLFYSTILEYREYVLFTFSGSNHSKDYKTLFNPNYPIDYYGNHKSYSEVSFEIGWSIDKS
jgi:hypothetical protein